MIVFLFLFPKFYLIFITKTQYHISFRRHFPASSDSTYQKQSDNILKSKSLYPTHFMASDKLPPSYPIIVLQRVCSRLATVKEKYLSPLTRRTQLGQDEFLSSLQSPRYNKVDGLFQVGVQMCESYTTRLQCIPHILMNSLFIGSNHMYRDVSKVA